MGKKVKLSGALKAYLLWPVILTVLLLGMNLSIYVINNNAGYVMSGFVLVYFLIAVSVYYLNRHKIASELVRYAMDYGQVQKRLLKELALPYAILDVDGRVQWGNDEFLDIIHEKKTARRSITNVFSEIKLDSLPTNENDEVLHISYNGRNYMVKLRKVKAPNFDEDANWNIYDPENAWDDKNALIAMYLYDETD
ncbi:MAG TPA: DHH family phosphoesterase, partial [Mobilitalea sp.]|nr:DHH family phosphoesterase [Mobilitalea sp.]